MSDDLFLAWAAGFFDGEGCVLVELSKNKECRHGMRTVLHVNVTQTSLYCLELFQERFGGSLKVYEHCSPGNLRQSVQYVWLARNKPAMDFLKAIYPYTVVKREQVAAAMKYPLTAPSGRKYGMVGNPIPDEVQNLRISIAHELRNIRASMKTAAKPPKEKPNA